MKKLLVNIIIGGAFGWFILGGLTDLFFPSFGMAVGKFLLGLLHSLFFNILPIFMILVETAGRIYRFFAALF